MWGASKEDDEPILEAGKSICPDLVIISGRYDINIDIYNTDTCLLDSELGIETFSVSRS